MSASLPDREFTKVLQGVPWLGISNLWTSACGLSSLGAFEAFHDVGGNAYKSSSKSPWSVIVNSPSYSEPTGESPL